MNIKTLPVGQLETNCYVVINEETLECVVIDPGDESNTIMDYIESNNLECKAIMLTHGHFDHVGAVNAVAEQTGCTVYINPRDEGYKVGMSGMMFKLPEGGRYYDDGDGIIIEQVKKKGFQGYMMVVLDPSRVFVGKPQSFGGYGDYLATMCERYGAVAGINGGAYLDVNGAGLGGTPQGLTIIDGVCYDDANGEASSFVGFDANHILHTGYMTYADAQEKGIVDGVTFEPVLIVNGQMEDASVLNTGTNPRTAIGQRADGAVLMLVIDGRQVHSTGATQQDVAEVMLDYGAVNACSAAPSVRRPLSA